jgi:cation diffusion facilitator family transporter
MMHSRDLSRWQHGHHFAVESSTAEKNTRRVLALTAGMMVVEILGGLRFHSMALLADGWHMATHVAAFAITTAAYWLSRRHADNTRFSFGTGKVGVLGAYTSAIILGGIALYMAGESVARLFVPQSIAFRQAIPIAFVGLGVNVLSAFLLKHEHGDHQHSHDAPHKHGHHHDLNLRAAYIHVIADALTSVLAIIALTFGLFFGWLRLDPIMGIVGSAVIAQWAYALIRDTNPILLDTEPIYSDLSAEIRKALEAFEDVVVSDLHVWQVGSGKYAAIVSIVTHNPKSPDEYKALFCEHEELVHATVEVHRCDDAAVPA